MARLAVRITPRAGRDAIEGWRGDVLRVRVAAPPVEGRANEALLRLLAAALGVPVRDLTIVAGAAARQKLVDVAGMDDATLRASLGGPAF